MLPLPRLDDENFEEILADAKRQIPGLTSEWTDFNYHDPGITLLQLLAWLKEMQQFYIDGIGDMHRLKYLKLLGCTPLKMQGARADISVEGLKDDTVFPVGTKFDARGVVFETSGLACIPSANICRLQSVKKDGRTDITHILSKGGDGLPDYIFGERPEAGCQLLLGFDRELPEGLPLSLYIGLFDSKGITRNRIEGHGIYPMAVSRWEYRSGGEWKGISGLEDGTCGFIRSGYIDFTISGLMEAWAVEGCAEELYWMRCVLDNCNYDLAPKVESISLHNLRVTQKDTGVEMVHFDGTGKEGQELVLENYLALSGQPEVQVLTGDGLWMTWDSFDVEEGGKWWSRSIVLKPDESGRMPEAGTGNIRVICRNSRLNGRDIVAGSTGYPEQKYEIGFDGVLYDSFELQVGVHRGGKLLWQDWKKSEDLLLQNSGDLCYQLDTKDGELVFGDGENGAIPPAGAHNIRIVSCAETQGLDGNVKAGCVDGICMAGSRMEDALQGIRIYNTRYAEGGRDSEGQEEALQRFRKDFMKASRAITAEDYEKITAETPGLIISKVRAIPSYRPGTGYLGPDDRGSCITVVVKAYSDRTFKPDLNEAYLVNIKRHLDRYRLITTEVHVIPPRYIGINVFCTVEIKPYYKDVKAIIRDFFEQELNAVYGKRDFGQNVEYGDIYGKIESMDCVRRVTGLTLDARGAGVVKKYGGDILIPPDCLTYLESLDVEIKE